MIMTMLYFVIMCMIYKQTRCFKRIKTINFGNKQWGYTKFSWLSANSKVNNKGVNCYNSSIETHPHVSQLHLNV